MNRIFNILSCDFNNKLELPLYVSYDDNLNYYLKFNNEKQFNLNILYKYFIVFILLNAKLKYPYFCCFWYTRVFIFKIPDCI